LHQSPITVHTATAAAPINDINPNFLSLSTLADQTQKNQRKFQEHDGHHQHFPDPLNTKPFSNPPTQIHHTKFKRLNRHYHLNSAKSS
jgi:hypothetical protein